MEAIDVTFIFDSSTFGITGTTSLLSAINTTVETIWSKTVNTRFTVLLNSCSNFQNFPLTRNVGASYNNDFEAQFNGLEHLLVQYGIAIDAYQNGERSQSKQLSIIFVNRELTCGMEEQIKRLRELSVNLRFVVFRGSGVTEMYTFVDRKRHLVSFSDPMKDNGVSEVLTNFICNP